MSSPTADPRTGITTEADEAPEGEEPTPEEIEQVKWAEEAARNAPALLRDSLRQLITLGTALLAGSAAFLNQVPMPKWMKALGAACLLLSLFGALWGNFPRELLVCPYAPEEIRRARERSLANRLWWLKWAGTWLFAALLAFMAGLLA
jgi:hypothetical protein